MSTKSDPAIGAYPVTPSDTARVAYRSLYIGGEGDVAVLTKGRDQPVTFVGHPVGYMPVEVTKVLSNGTTATNIIGLV